LKGYYTAYADGGTRPAVWALVIDKNGQSRSNQMIVKLNGKNRRIRVYSSSGGRLSVDVVGWYTGKSSANLTTGLFIPTRHLRRLDKMTGLPVAPLGPFTFEFSIGTTLPVSAVVGNIVSAGMWDPGVVTAKPAGVATSSVVAVHTTAWPQQVASHFMLRTSSRGIALTSKIGGYLVVDVSGFFYGPSPKATLPTPKNRSLLPTTVNAVRWTDAAGAHIRSVQYRADDNLDAIANTGVGAAYHNLNRLQRAGNVMVFAHRTEHGGLFRYINTIPVGAMFSLRGANGHWYNYRVMYVGVTFPTYRDIANITRYFPPITAQLVACSNPDGSATSLNWRITVSGRLISVT
jgi:hypothetical protein